MQISRHLTDEAVLNELGARLTAARLACRATQEAFAERAGVRAATVQAAETGLPISLPDFLRLLRVVDGLDGLDALLATPASAAPGAPSGFVVRDNRGRQRAAGRRQRGPIDRRSSGGPKPPGRFIWGDDPPPADA